ncbi:MAG: UPF0149 family protein [Proteobacteria bacterium]|nr:UPF0149 family protein [Pseudomonadota bacterium]
MDHDDLQGALTPEEMLDLDQRLELIDAMSLGMVEGFVTAVFINPRQVLAEEFFPWIWDPELGEAAPSLEDQTELEGTFFLLSRFVANVALDLSQSLQRFEPLFLRDPGLASSVDWCNGFMTGTRFHMGLWERVAKEAPELFEAIGRLSDADDEADREELERLVAPSVLGIAIELDAQREND